MNYQNKYRKILYKIKKENKIYLLRKNLKVKRKSKKLDLAKI